MIIHLLHSDIVVESLMTTLVIVSCMLVVSEVTWHETSGLILHVWVMVFLCTVMLPLHWLEGVSSAEESFNLWVVVIVVHRLDQLRVVSLKLYVVELVWQSSDRVANVLVCVVVCGWWLTALEVKSAIFSIDTLVNFGRSWHFAWLVSHLFLLLELRWSRLLKLFGVDKLWLAVIVESRLDNMTKRGWMLVAILEILGHWLQSHVGFLWSVSKLLLELIFLDLSSETESLRLLSSGLSLVLGLVIDFLIQEWHAWNQVTHLSLVSLSVSLCKAERLVEIASKFVEVIHVEHLTLPECTMVILTVLTDNGDFTLRLKGHDRDC